MGFLILIACIMEATGIYVWIYLIVKIVTWWIRGR